MTVIKGWSQLEAKHQRSFTIYSCEPGFSYHFDGSKVEFRDFKTPTYTKALDSSTIANFNILFDRFAQLDQKVVYRNDCIDDGFNFKIYVRVDSSTQKVFVGNYYDKLVDDLTGLFDQCLVDFHPRYIHTIGYGADREYIVRLI